MSLFEVRTEVLLAAGEGTPPAGAMSKFGVPAVMSKWDLFALGGRMFNLGEGTVGTVLTGQAVNAAGIVLTAPAIRLAVPTGTTIFPRRLNLAIETTAGTLNEIAVVASDTDSYTSGGTAVVPKNWRMDDKRSSAMENVYHCSGSAIVEAALTNPRHLWKYVRPAAFTAGETFEGLTTVKWDDLIPLIGPCSFLVYLGAATTALTYMFALDWAEVDSAVV
ncbi:MAG: hypothetical protein QG671_3503 [Actinomycetota bacterium]|nr:hypothetical protein [Actinomycetota bacterium]